MVRVVVQEEEVDRVDQAAVEAQAVEAVLLLVAVHSVVLPVMPCLRLVDRVVVHRGFVQVDLPETEHL